MCWKAAAVPLKPAVIISSCCCWSSSSSASETGARGVVGRLHESRRYRAAKCLESSNVLQLPEQGAETKRKTGT
jgi:hypothetical protein